jgi:hypothetical protein
MYSKSAKRIYNVVFSAGTKFVCDSWFLISSQMFDYVLSLVQKSLAINSRVNCKEIGSSSKSDKVDVWQKCVKIGVRPLNYWTKTKVWKNRTQDQNSLTLSNLVCFFYCIQYLEFQFCFALCLVPRKETCCWCKLLRTLRGILTLECFLLYVKFHHTFSNI